jgi:hypothetical protein
MTWLALLVGTLIFTFSQQQLNAVKRAHVSAELEVALPLFVQVIMAGGDRNLAANWGAIRALVTETARMNDDDFVLLGRVQDDVSWLNPGHEDNYYIAAAILPWDGQLNVAQRVLNRAIRARPFDYQPPFYYAFHLVHFSGDGFGAAQVLRQSAQHLVDPGERLVMESFAARWIERSSDLELAARVVDAMAATTQRKDFATHLRLRSKRLRDLNALRRAAIVYEQTHGARPATLKALVATGLIEKIPDDPLGSGFGLDQAGVPVLLGARQR